MEMESKIEIIINTIKPLGCKIVTQGTRMDGSVLLSVIVDTVPLCERCEKRKAQRPHKCPRNYELYGDKGKCTCCPECESDCKDEI